MANPVGDVDAWPVAELVAALLIGGASRAPCKRSLELRARDVASELLAELGGAAGLARATAEELEARLEALESAQLAPGRSARAIACAFALARRVVEEQAAPASIASSADVATWASPRLSGLDHEELWLLALDGRSRLRAVRCVAKGGLHGMGVRATDPLRIALRAAASGFVLVHNHPSGDPTPSAEDIAFTRRVAAAGAVVGVPLLDHVVVSRGGFASVPFPVGLETEAAASCEAVA